MNKLEKELNTAQRELDDAIIVVARCAQEVSDNARQVDDTYSVDPEVMVELRNALAHWKACTQKFLEAVDAVGTQQLAASYCEECDR